MTNKNSKNIRNDFLEKLYSQIKPEIIQFEKERKKQYFKLLLLTGGYIFLSFFFAAFALVCCVIKTEATAIYLNIILCFLFIYAAGIAYKKSNKEFETKIKKLIMPLIINSFENIEWKSGSFILDNEILTQSMLLPDYGLGKPDDSFSGSYNGVNFKIQEVLRSNETKYINRFQRNVYGRFNGVIIEIDMKKWFEGHTVIRTNEVIKQFEENLFKQHLSGNKDYKYLHNDYKFYKKDFPLSSLKHTEFEDIKFNQLFDVYTDNEIEARYLLTPTFMEKMYNIKTRIPTKRIFAACYANKLFIALQTKEDLFSVAKLSRPLSDLKLPYIVFEQIFSVRQLVDYLEPDKNL